MSRIIAIAIIVASAAALTAFTVAEAATRLAALTPNIWYHG